MHFFLSHRGGLADAVTTGSDCGGGRREASYTQKACIGDILQSKVCGSVLFDVVLSFHVSFIKHCGKTEDSWSFPKNILIVIPELSTNNNCIFDFGLFPYLICNNIEMVAVFSVLIVGYVVLSYISVDGFISKGVRSKRGASVTARNMFSGIVEVV